MQFIYSQEEKPLFYTTHNNKITAIDTNDIVSFHEYRKDNQYLWLGNNGLANYSLLFNSKHQSNFLNSNLIRPFENLENRTYNVAQPFTSATYVQGARLEQFFNVLHTQNFSKTGNFSIEYTKVNAGGSYVRQKANNNNILGTFNYTTPKSNYTTEFYARRVKNTTQQNGGLVNDSSFLFPGEFGLNRRTLDVNLDSAYEQRIANILTLKQELVLQRKLDSLGFGKSQKIILNSSFTNAKRFYRDENVNTDFYNQIIFDSTETNDSLKLNRISNELSYAFESVLKGSSFMFNPYIIHEYLDYRQANAHSFYNDIAVGTRLNIKKTKNQFNTNLRYYLAGYQQENYSWKTTFSNQLKSIGWSINANLNKETSAIDLQNYSGNHHAWSNTFLPIETYNFKIAIDSNKWNLRASVDYTDIKNPIYFNYNQEPVQALDFTQVIKAELEKDFKLKKWQLTPRFAYQHTGGTIVYRLPNYFASLKAGYGFKAFRKTLSVFTGIKLTYYSDVQLMSYSPALGQFYIANNTSVGNYPFVDFFVNTRVKNVRIFFALSHFNSGLTNDFNYFGATNHPLEDRAFKIGINWNFLK